MTGDGGWPDPFGPSELAGQTALVTGAAQGIGAAIAGRLADLGAAVAVSDRNEHGALAKAKELEAGGARAVGLRLDVRDSEEIEAAVSRASERLGPIDVLVNNAGLFILTESTDVPDEEWQLQIDVMLSGPFKVTRRVGREMLRRGTGSVVNICSIGGFGGHPQRTAYNAAKGGIKVMTEVLATEWASRGIRVNAVAPAVTRTEILTNVIRSAGGAIKVDEYEQRTPLGRIAETEEIADAVAFLASSRAAYITGETLVVDGGWLASDGFPAAAAGAVPGDPVASQ
ncbi:MAG TPA: SDR family NAD(P)-dependent oxidoreductase [Solirubrobacteraceae bacterium]